MAQSGPAASTLEGILACVFTCSQACRRMVVADGVDRSRTRSQVRLARDTGSCRLIKGRRPVSTSPSTVVLASSRIRQHPPGSAARA